MLERKARADKILVLGVDGLDPRLTRKLVDEGKMPNTKKYIEAGAQRHDLVMLGSHPTITPPQWTTLACGCHAYAHGINAYHRRGSEIGTQAYNLDSRLCKAEQVWNCFAEAGKKTLVFHWPGSSWPPTSDNENLMVVDGSSPGPVNMATAQVDHDFLLIASAKTERLEFAKSINESSEMCIMEDVDAADAEATQIAVDDPDSIVKSQINVIWKKEQQSTNHTSNLPDILNSPIKPATGWAAAPADAKEFTILLSEGLIQRPALILKNEDGIYDRVAVYKNKKSIEPMVVCPLGEYVVGVVDEAYKNDVKYEKVNRDFRLLRLSEDGNELKMFVTAGNDMTNDVVWHPKRLYKEVTENVGYPVPCVNQGAQDDMLITECMLANWGAGADWHAAAILQLIKDENLDVVFSHFHNVDLQLHKIISHMAEVPKNYHPVEVYRKWAENIYIQTDEYLGKFLHLLDEGWTIIITSDHGLVPGTYDVPMIQDANGVCTEIMEELGYTVLKRDKDGNRIGEVDWTKTRAIVQNEGHIYLNIKGRNKHSMSDGTVIDGIVDPEDQYALEEQIMTDLYSLKHPDTGRRYVALALRNKDCVHLGQGGPECGDIFFWNAEGYNMDHGDGLSTTYGEGDTSLSPIFIAAGPGIKKGFETDRVIRQIDFAPTVAFLGGVRTPANCEGAPVYQIFEDEV